LFGKCVITQSKIAQLSIAICILRSEFGIRQRLQLFIGDIFLPEDVYLITNTIQMTGVVLCGGQSMRMGIDKGLINSETDAKVWAKIARDKFSKVSISSFLSINESQTKNYLLHFKEDELIVDNPNLKVQGPLLGLLSIHLKYPDQDLMVIACDMINMKELVLKELSDSFNSSKTEAIVFRGERVEPLCGIYSSQGLSKIYNAHRQNEMSNNSLMHALEKLKTSYIPIPKEWNAFFKNFNCKEDIE
jgi:molybdopterin-guanine dinucleotide biosynthesis protein A